MSTVSIILIALIIEYFFDDLKKYRKNDILVNGYNYFQKKLDTGKYSKINICIAFAIIVLIISMSIASIADYISKIIFFIVSLIFLLFSLRTNQFNRDMEELKIKLEFDKDSIEKNILFSLCPNLRQTRAKTNLNELVIKNLFFNSIRNTFTIIFVFILLGAPAALTYKVLDIMIYSDNFKLNIQTKNELKKYIYFIDYIPIRLTSYCLSMVSNYDRVMERINNLELSNNAYLSNIEYINQTGESVYDNSKSESDQIIQIQNILSRTLIAWLSLIFLLGITGIFI
ncbi:MAG: hypothetical protein VX093_03450 [Pseudomonadota bacterium]|nr:hypothetical protein [Pseudomonadota bacterium]